MLGSMLRELRGERAARDVAAALGVPRSTVYAWEGPDSRPTAVSLRRLLDYYGASPAQRLAIYEMRGLS